MTAERVPLPPDLGACPLLGLPDDPSTHFSFTHSAHRCYATNKHTGIGLAYQADYCLSSAYTACPLYAASGHGRPATMDSRNGRPAPTDSLPWAVPQPSRPLPVEIDRGATPAPAPPASASTGGWLPPEDWGSATALVGSTVAVSAEKGAAWGAEGEGVPAATHSTNGWPDSSGRVLLGSRSAATGHEGIVQPAPRPTITPVVVGLGQPKQTSRRGRGRRKVSRPLAVALVALFVVAAAAGFWATQSGLGNSGVMLPTVTPEATVIPTPASTPSPSPTPTATPSPTPIPTVQPTIYIVQRGDSLISIAAQFGTTKERIAEVNNIDNPSLIEIGQELIIPSD